MRLARHAIFVTALLHIALPAAEGIITAVRLVGHDDARREGQLEVQWLGAWRALCFPGDFDHQGKDNYTAMARVACRQLGFGGGEMVETDYGNSNVLALEKLECKGSEATLAQCKLQQAAAGAVGECHEYSDDLESPSMAMVVKCGGSSITGARLAGYPGQPWHGVMQVQWAGKWRSVCSTGYETAARVVCRQLGYSAGSLSDAPSVDGPAVGLDLNCTGAESSLSQCSYRWGSSDDCSNVAASCSGGLPVESMRLAGGKLPGEGRLQVLSNGTWRHVCNTWASWGVGFRWMAQELDRNADRREFEQAARVICRQLGFAAGDWTPVHRGGGIFGGGSPEERYINILGCNGNERSLGQCILEADAAYGTTCNGLFALACQGSNIISRLKLGGVGATKTSGRVDVQLRTGQWRTIDAGGTYSRDLLRGQARAVCRSLGLGGGTARVDFYSRGPPPGLSNVRCTGDETSLSACAFDASTNSPPAEPGCTNTGPNGENPQPCWIPPAGVACAGTNDMSVRLAKGFSSKEGRVEVYVKPWARWSSLWGLVPPEVAQVVCRQLGWQGGALRGKDDDFESFYGTEGAPLPLLGAVLCTGQEASLSECDALNSTSGGWLYPSKDLFGVACKGASTFTRLRLAGGPSRAEGRLEVEMQGRWGMLCYDKGNDWDGAVDMSGVARVACRQLGYIAGKLMPASKYGTTSLKPLVELSAKRTCTGSEGTLSECALLKQGLCSGATTPANIAVACSGPRRNPVNFFTVLKGSCLHTCEWHGQVHIGGSMPLCRKTLAFGTVYGTHLASDGTCRYAAAGQQFADRQGFRCGCALATDFAPNRLRWQRGTACPAGTQPASSFRNPCQVPRPHGRWVMGWMQTGAWLKQPVCTVANRVAVLSAPPTGATVADVSPYVLCWE